MGDEERDPLAPLGSSRREFVKRMIAAGFSAPLIGSFGFAELASASEHHFPNQTFPNQTHDDDRGDRHDRHEHHHRKDDDDDDRR